MSVGANDASVSALDVSVSRRGELPFPQQLLYLLHTRRNAGENERHKTQVLIFQNGPQKGLGEVLLSLQQKWVAAVGSVTTAKSIHS